MERGHGSSSWSAIGLVLILLIGSVGCCYGLCRSSDANALLNLKAGLLDYGGRLKAWQAGTNCCAWYGVSCAGDLQTVNGLSLEGLQVDRSKPQLWAQAVGNLTELISLSLAGLKILGPYPTFIPKLQKLQVLSTERCNITGPLPPEIGQLRNLSSFSMDTEPAMTGPIPKEFCNLTNLVDFEIYDIPFTGFPDCFEGMTKLFFAVIQHTQIRSPIPTSFAKCPKLESLILNYNLISGPIPDIFATLPNLGYLELISNQLTGPFPKSLAEHTPAVLIYIDNNFLEGPLPDLSKLTQLQELKLTGNRLSGPLPRSIENLTQLSILLLDNNSFSGPIPPNFCNFCTIGEARQCTISLTYNLLTGWIPPTFLNVTNFNSTYNLLLQAFFDLSHNGLSGPIPPLIGPHLQSFLASHNFLTGGFPLQLATVEIVDVSYNHLNDASQIGQVPDLYLNNPNPSLYNPQKILQLNLGNNQLRGPLPQWLFMLSNSVSVLDISANYLWGVLPDAVYNFAYMYSLNASHNYFSGGLPKQPFSRTPFPTVIAVLDVHHNYFSGAIPVSFFKAINASGGVTVMDLSENRLTGGLSTEIGNLGPGNNLFGLYPERIDLSNNMLSGPIPPEIGKLVYLKYLDLSQNDFSGSFPASIANLLVNNRLTYLDVRGNELQYH